MVPAPPATPALARGLLRRRVARAGIGIRRAKLLFMGVALLFVVVDIQSFVFVANVAKTQAPILVLARGPVKA
ncbi:hypothetical protein GCM10027428_15600 [Haliea atlantica]